MKKNTPVPIFNHRKRPRQAVIADPQNIDGPGTSGPTNTQQSSHPYKDLMPVHGFDNKRNMSNKPKQEYQSYQQQNKSQHSQQYQQQNRQQQQQNNHYSYNTNGPSPGRQSQTLNKDFQGPNRGVTGGTLTPVSRTGSAPSNSNRQLTGQSGQGWQADRQQSQRWSSGQAPYTNKQVASSQAYHQQTPQSYPNIGNNMSNSCGQQQNRQNNRNNNYNSQAGNQYMFQTDHSGSTSSRTNTYMNQKPFQTGRHGNQNFLMPGPSGAATSQETDNCRSQFQPQGYQQVGGFGDSSSKPPISSKQKEIKKAPKKSETKADKSLHLITSTISGIKHWSQYKNTINMIFEVYGVVDSAMMQDSSATGKEFLIKDEQDSLPCVFFEIDRQLPRLTRGHWHRCVGSMDGKSGKLKCVSVRPASVEEKDISKLSIENSDTFLWDLTKTTPEP